MIYDYSCAMITLSQYDHAEYINVIKLKTNMLINNVTFSLTQRYINTASSPPPHYVNLQNLVTLVLISGKSQLFWTDIWKLSFAKSKLRLKTGLSC